MFEIFGTAAGGCTAIVAAAPLRDRSLLNVAGSSLLALSCSSAVSRETFVVAKPPVLDVICRGGLGV
jgi:hypothetical protein